jgi:hypothetical protein
MCGITRVCNTRAKSYKNSVFLKIEWNGDFFENSHLENGLLIPSVTVFLKFMAVITVLRWLQWPSGVRRGSAADRLPELRVRIPLGA